MFNFFGYFISATVIVLIILISWFIIQFRNEARYLRKLKAKETPGGE